MSLNTPRPHTSSRGIGLLDRYPIALVVGALLGMAGVPLVQKITKKYTDSTAAIVATAPLDNTIGEKIILEMNYDHLPEAERLSVQRLMHPGNKEHYKVTQQGTVNNIEFKQWESAGFRYVEYYDHTGKVVAREDVSPGRVTEKIMLDNNKQNTKVKGARLVFFDAENKPFGGYDLYGAKVNSKSYYHTLAHHLKKAGNGVNFSEQLHIFSELGFVYVSDRENGIFKTLYKGDESVHSADETIQRAQIHDAGEKNSLHGMLFGDCDDFAEIMERIIRCAEGEDYPVVSIHVPQHATAVYREPGTGAICTVCTMGGVYRGGKHFGPQSFKEGKPTGDQLDQLNKALGRYFEGGDAQENMRNFMPKTAHYPLTSGGELCVNIILGKGQRGREFLPWKNFLGEKFTKFYQEKLKPKEKK